MSRATELELKPSVRGVHLPIRLDGKGRLHSQLDRALRAAILGGRLA